MKQRIKYGIGKTAITYTVHLMPNVGYGAIFCLISEGIRRFH